MNALSRRRFLQSSALLAGAAWLPRSLRADAPAPPPMNGINGFGLALHKELCGEKGNVFTSPYSISTALAMCAAGAKGNTLEQMRTVLHQAGNPQEVDASYAKLAKSLGEADKSIQINIANALWAQPGYPWNPSYVKRVKATFHAGIQDTDFQANPEESRTKINGWVEKQTKEKIKDLMPKGSIDASTRLVLTNAIYFKADWLEAFKKDVTRDTPFMQLDGTKTNVPMMYRSGKIDYFNNDEATVIRLPYKGKDISFIGLLPKNPEKFEQFEKEGIRNSINTWLDGLKPAGDVRVWLPRFKIETSYTLNDTLIRMGMGDAFSGKADFGGMVTTASQLVISIVVHKAYVDVNEQGTEAAAATGVGMKLAAPPPPEPKVWKGDRPFLFALRHEPTGTLLFLGRYSKVG